MIRNVPVPFGLNTEEANISSTCWRTVADHKNLKYYFGSAVSPNVFWVDLKQINFKQSQTRKLNLGKDQAIAYAGDATAKFVETAPFSFLGVNP